MGACGRCHQRNEKDRCFFDPWPLQAQDSYEASDEGRQEGGFRESGHGESQADALATQCELKKAVCSKVLDTLAGVATKEVKKTGVFSIPGLCRLKIRTKPATKAGKREVFGKVVMVKAKPARKIVKAFPVTALKASI